MAKQKKSLEEIIGSRIRTLREMQLYSREKFSERAGLPYNTYRRIERGQSMTIPNLAAVADALGIPLAALFEEERVQEYRDAPQKLLHDTFLSMTEDLSEDSLETLRTLLVSLDQLLRAQHSDDQSS